VARDAGTTQPFARQAVDEHLPLDLANLVGDHRAELRLQDVAVAPAVIGDRRVAIWLAAAAPAADAPRFDSGQPLSPELPEWPRL
jgi:hypothetical protein